MPTRGQLVRCLTTGELLTSWCIVVVCQTVGALHGVDLVQGENAQKGAALKKDGGHVARLSVHQTRLCRFDCTRCSRMKETVHACTLETGNNSCGRGSKWGRKEEEETPGKRLLTAGCPDALALSSS